MRHSMRKWNPMLRSMVMLSALALMFCEPGKALDPVVKDPGNEDTGKVAAIRLLSAPQSLLPSDTGLVRVTVRDSSDSLPLAGARLAVTSSQFKVLSAAGSGEFGLDAVPLDGTVNFRITSGTPGTGTVTVRVISGDKSRSISFQVIVTEKPVAPKVIEDFPSSMNLADTIILALVIADSAQERPLANAIATLSSQTFTFHELGSPKTLSSDTTAADGKVSFRLAAKSAGGGSFQVRVNTAAGLVRTTTYTLTVNDIVGTERPRKMVFTAARSTLRADGSDSTELRVLVKDDNNNPLSGEKIRFTATGGLVKGSATTDEWGKAVTYLVSERANKIVVVTATLEKTGATAQQTVAFDGVTVVISTDKKVLMQNQVDNVTFTLKDGGDVPMSGDSLEVTIQGAQKGFTGRDLGSVPETLVVVTNTKGQYQGSFTRASAGKVIVTGRALGARSSDTVLFTNDNLTLGTSGGKTFLSGDGTDVITVAATLVDGNGVGRSGYELRWTTTFGTFTTTPFTSTDGSGRAQIVLRAPKGSGLAIVNVEAYEKGGGDARTLAASGNITIPVRALRVNRLELKVTPDNIPVKVGESRLLAQAFDSAGNVMTGVLVGFRLVKGAGGGDEVIAPPVDYTRSGTAEAVLKAGGVISLYRGVQLSAVALDISGSDTLVIASSDTVGLTISGPPHRVSVGVNIEKGINPEDGTFALPTAAVVTDVNGNLVADGTPVNFSTTPTGAFYHGVTWRHTDSWPYYVIGDTVAYYLPWTDYNNNQKLDPGEPLSSYDLTRSKPARGEDKDGNGFINFPPESFIDLDGDGVWDAYDAEPLIQSPPTDTSGRQLWVDFNKNGRRDTVEPFFDFNGDGICQCTGQRDANGALYEDTYFGSTATHPFPGEVSVGITKQIPTGAGKALNQIVYVQSLARKVEVRITAESNGIRSFVDVVLPIVKSEE